LIIFCRDYRYQITFIQPFLSLTFYQESRLKTGFFVGLKSLIIIRFNGFDIIGLNLTKAIGYDMMITRKLSKTHIFSRKFFNIIIGQETKT